MTTILVIILWILAILLLVNGCIGIFLLKTQDSKSEQKATVVPNKNTTKKDGKSYIKFEETLDSHVALPDLTEYTLKTDTGLDLEVKNFLTE